MERESVVKEGRMSGGGGIVVVPFPVQSHISPLLHLSHHLASQALHITFVLPLHAYSRILHSQHSALSSPHLQLLGLPDGLPQSHAPRDIGLEFAAVCNLQPQVELLAQEHLRNGTPFTCILTDPMVPWSQAFSRKFAIAYVSFCVTSAAAYGAFLYAPSLIANGVLPLKVADRTDPSAAITVLPSFPKLLVSDIPGDIAGEFSTFMELHKRSSEADWILVHSVYELEKASIDALRKEGLPMLTVGPANVYSAGTLGRSLWEADTSCMHWLDEKKPESVVYVSFGSVIDLPLHELRELALGIENSGHAFLWVLRPKPQNKMTEKSLSVEEMLPEGFLDRTKHRGQVVSWVSQLEVLAHPSIGAFFFQFGWSSALESISMGVPMMGWPVFADNPANCRALVNECGVALECKKGKDGIVERWEVEKMIKAVMQGEEGKTLRKKAKEMKGVVANATSEEGSTFNSLTTFIEDMKKRASLTTSLPN